MDPGLRLKNVRERLGLRYRDVEQASNIIAKRRKSSDFVVGLSRLADIENRGVIPSLHRIYSLCSIYRIDFEEVLSWYGAPLSEIWADATTVHPPATHLVGVYHSPRSSMRLPLHIDPGVDFNKTQFLSRLVQQWGRVPMMMLNGLDYESGRYGMIGWEDHRMSPMIRPGAIVQIDTNRRQVQESGWTNEFDRPIYFLELRAGYACCWCSRSEDKLIMQPHHSSPDSPEIVDFKKDVDVIGQVVGVAMRFNPDPPPFRPARRKTRAVSAPK